MATVKVTVTVQEEQLTEVRELVAQGKASSVSGFVQHAVSVSLDDVRGWRKMLDEVLEENGPLTQEEQRWVDHAMALATADE